MSRSQLNQTLDALYAAQPITLKPDLTQYPLSPEDIEIAESGGVHNNIECEVCNIINKEA